MVNFFDGGLFGNPLKSFIENNIEVTTQGYVVMDNVYKLFEKYRKDKGLPRLSKNDFNVLMERQLPVTENKLRIGWRNKTVWQGIRLRDIPE